MTYRSNMMAYTAAILGASIALISVTCVDLPVPRRGATLEDHVNLYEPPHRAEAYGLAAGGLLMIGGLLTVSRDST